MSFTAMLMKSAGMALTGGALEAKFGPHPEKHNLFFLTPAIFSMMGMWVTSFGMKVGAGRRKAIEDAKKDGEKDVEDRYDLPNLYAQGTSKHAKVFNCIQRAHQHIFETFPQAIVTGLVGAASFPLTSAASSLMYFVGRVYLSNGYAESEGEPSKRYSSPLAVFTWYGLVTNWLLAMASCVFQLAGKKMLCGVE
jgi:hypothetical protein